MRDLVHGLSGRIRDLVRAGRGRVSARYISGVAKGGDAEFPVDVLAEDAAWAYLQESGQAVAVYTESEGLRVIGNNPRYIFVIDPIDGTRGAAANFETACVSIAVARYSESPMIGDIEFAMLQELKTGNWIYADDSMQGLDCEGYDGPLPRRGSTTNPERMFWSLEFNGHPAAMMIAAYGHLIDASSNRGGVFVFNSASFSISRIITGQMDAYVDIGNRMLRDHPETEADFRRVGHGSILHLFPYDIAASVYLAERAGVIITDAYGKSLNETRLLDIGPMNQQSCLAACTQELHNALLTGIYW